MIQINGKKATIANVTATTFEMTGVDSSAFTVYTGGGFAMRASTKPAIYMNRMLQHSFDTCYVVAYGDDAIHIDFPDGRDIEHCLFDFLVEGACARSQYRITTSATVESLIGCKLKAYNTHTRGSILSTNIVGAGAVTFYGGAFEIKSHTYDAALPLVTPGSEGEFGFYGVDIEYPNRAGVKPNDYLSFNGKLTCIDDGEVVLWNNEFNDSGDGAFVPTVTGVSGSGGTYTINKAKVRYLGAMVWVAYDITITTNGTWAGGIVFGLPVVSSADGANLPLLGRVTGTGQSLQGLILNGQSTFTIYKYDGSHPAVDGSTIRISGWYERA